MKGIAFVLLGLLFAPQNDVIGKVESSFDKNVNFSSFRTYAWLRGYNAYNPEAHKIVVAALEGEMAKLGFTKVETEKDADVTLAYYTVVGTDVDLKALDKMEREGKTGPPPTKARARLVVIMRTAVASRQIWSASTREHLDPDVAKLNTTVEAVAARLFNVYPGRRRSG